MNSIELKNGNGGNPDRMIVSRRNFFIRGVSATAALLAARNGLETFEGPKIAEAITLPPFERGKYQTFPRLVDALGNIAVLQQIDLGTLGPDVDTIFGIDFEGDIPTGALVIHRPAGEILETRVVGIKRVDLETVQFQGAIGGDRFDIQKMSEFGGDPALDAMARLHAQNTARLYQKVVYIGDLGLFEKQWGQNEGAFLRAIIRAQRPGLANIIPESNFVNPRRFQ